MALESVGPQFTVHQVAGFPSFHEAEVLEQEMLAEAGLPAELAARARRPSPTAFHVATDPSGAPVGVACSTIGPLADLPLGLALAAAGMDLELEDHLPDPACELVSVSVDLEAVGREHIGGVTEALYRSFYRRARASAARTAVVGVDPWLFDVLTEEYGIAFEIIGPPITLLGRDLLAVGGELDALEEGVRVARPDFASYLDEPYGELLAGGPA